VRDEAASSADEALARLRQAAADGDAYRVVIVDGGFTRSIQDEPALAGTRVIVLTHHLQRFVPSGAGITVGLSKPVKLMALRNCLLSLLDAMPAVPTPEAMTPPRAAEPPSSGAAAPLHRVLLVEDNGVNQRLAARLLEKHGCSVELAGDGRAAVSAFERGSFDLILMDCHMPEMDGYEATRAIRSLEQQRGGARTRIVALTANAMEGDRDICLKAGMDDYIAKPIDLEELKAVLQRNLPPLSHAA